MALIRSLTGSSGGGGGYVSGTILPSDWTSQDGNGTYTTDNLGFVPKVICWYADSSTQYHFMYIYDADNSTSTYLGIKNDTWQYNNSVGDSSSTAPWCSLYNIDSTNKTITFRRYASTYCSPSIHWVAIG